MRPWLTAGLLILLLLAMALCAAQAEPGEIRVLVDGRELAADVTPLVVDGRTLVPLRAIFTALGAGVDWDEASQTVIARRDDLELRLTIGGGALKNGAPVQLDVPARLVAGRTLVPLRFVAESFGCRVDWRDDTRTVAIASQAATYGRTRAELSPFREIRYANGDSYLGELAGRTRAGRGRYTWSSGDAFDGHWSAGNMAGHGALVYGNGHKYVGGFAGNRRHGYGVYTWPNGDAYAGEWQNDQMHGQGQYTFANGDQYEGAWANNRMHGYGVYRAAGGGTLRGDWSNGVYQRAAGGQRE